MEMPKKSPTSTRGFASMDREKQRAIARKGGESVPNEKRSFSQNPRLAAEAGRKGGQSVNPAKRSFSRNHALASEAGRKGGHASHTGPKKVGGQVAIDRTSKFAFVELHEKATTKVAAEFLRHLIAAVPYKIHTVLTDTCPTRSIQFLPITVSTSRYQAAVA